MFPLTKTIYRTFPVAFAFAVFEINARFKRSLLGTFWYTLSTALIIFGLGPLYAKIFSQPLAGYFQYIAYGIIFWNFLQGSITEATGIYSANSSYTKDLGIHSVVFCVASVLKNTLILVQNYIAVIAIFLIAGFDFRLPSFTLVLILVFEAVLLVYVSFVISLASVRFRDLAPLIAVVMQLFFFLTPILWQTRLDFEDSIVIKFNPINHLITLPRELLLTGGLNWTAFGFVAISTVPALLVAEYTNHKFSKRAVFWL